MTSSTASKPQSVPWQLQAIRFGFRSFGNLMPWLAGRVAFRLFATPQRRLISRHTQKIMAQAQTVTIPYSYGKLAAYVWGSGPTILLIHGWENSASHLANFVQPLIARGFRVVALDAPAHGHSSGRQTNLIDYSQGLHAAIGMFGPIYGIVAHSFGGAATMFMLWQNRGVTVGKVVLLGTPSSMVDVFSRFATFLHIPESALQKMYQVIFQRFGFSVDSFSVDQAAESLNLPGLVIHDKADDVVPFADAEAIAGRWPAAKLLATEGLGTPQDIV